MASYLHVSKYIFLKKCSKIIIFHLLILITLNFCLSSFSPSSYFYFYAIFPRLILNNFILSQQFLYHWIFVDLDIWTFSFYLHQISSSFSGFREIFGNKTASQSYFHQLFKLTGLQASNAFSKISDESSFMKRVFKESRDELNNIFNMLKNVLSLSLS